MGDDDDPPVMWLVDIGMPHSLVATSFSNFLAGLILPEDLQPRLGTEGSDLYELDIEFVNDPAHRVEIEVGDTSCYDSDELVAVFDELLDSMMTKTLTPRSSPTESTPFDIRNSLTGLDLPPCYYRERRDPVCGVHARGFQNRMRPIVGLCVATALSLVEGSPIDDRINAFGHGRGARIHGADAATVLKSWRVDGTIDDLGLRVRDTVGPRVLNDIRPSNGQRTLLDRPGNQSGQVKAVVALKAYLETAQGERIGSCGYEAASAFLLTCSVETACIRFIDPYGDTIFNRPQCHVLIDEWAELGKQCPAELQPWWDCVAKLISRCRNEVHVYVRFVGYQDLCGGGDDEGAVTSGAEAAAVMASW